MKQRDQDLLFIKQLVNNINVGINVAQLCRVYRLEEDLSKADVQPLAKNANGSKRAPLLNVPVGMAAKNYVHVGGVVLVNFLDRSLGNWDGSGKCFSLENKRMHNVNDAVIVEVIS